MPMVVTGRLGMPEGSRGFLGECDTGVTTENKVVQVKNEQCEHGNRNDSNWNYRPQKRQWTNNESSKVHVTDKEIDVSLVDPE